MQNTMLDSAISSSMQLFQNAGFKIRVIMRDGEPWFVAKDACDCLAIADASQACQNLDDDEKQVVTREFDSLLFRESKAQAMTLISESGLYTLVMRSNKPEAKVFRKWVTSEVLPSIRKTGSYGMTQISRKDQLYLAIIHAESEAVRADALKELNEINKQEVKALEVERDEAIRTKALIGSRREATAMAMASAKSRECKRLTTENEELKDAVGRGNNWRTVAMMKAEWKREFGHEPDWRELKKFSADLPTEMRPVKDVEEKVIIQNGSEKVRLVNRYHREAWAKYREFEENLRANSTIKESLIVGDNIEVADVF